MRIINKTKEKEKDKTMDSYLTSNKYDVCDLLSLTISY